MWRHLLGRLNIVLHPWLRRQINPIKSINGIFCDSNCDGIAKDEVLCLIPFIHCISPNIAAASPWGKSLINMVSSYTVSSNGVQVEYSKESAITTAFCAIVMLSEENSLSDYLHWIVIERENEDSIRKKLGESACEKLQIINKLNNSIIHALCEDLAQAGVKIPVELMSKAHSICSSRCVDVPKSHAILGGPALVPFVDLINHAESEPNIEVYLETINSTKKLLKSSKSFPSKLWGKINENYCPFYIIVKCAKYIAAEEELHYHYIDILDNSCNDSLFWVSRFNFCP